MMPTPDYVLDACAALAYIKKEPGDIKVRELLEKATTGAATIYMHAANLLEVYYDRLYESEEEAEAAYNLIFDSDIKIIDSVQEVLREAARFKTSYGISFADSFAVAAAKILDAALITCDHEFDAISDDGEVSCYWIRPRATKSRTGASIPPPA